MSDFDADEDSAPEIKLIEREQYAELLNSFYSVLSDFEKKVLSMYLSGYTYNEISYRLNIEKKSADNALQRIKRKLRAVSLKPANHGAKHGGQSVFGYVSQSGHLYAETAVRNSFSPPVSRSSTQKRDLPTSLKHVRHAVWHANRRADPKESFTRLSAQNAAERLRFPLSPTTTALT